MTPQRDNLLDRLIAEAQADDYALAPQPGKTSRGLLPALLVFLVIGVLLVSAVAERQSARPAKAERRDALVARIEQAQQRAEESEVEAGQLRSSVSNLQRLASGGLSDQFSEQLQALEIATGFVGLSGPGAEVSLDDAENPPDGVDPEEARVLDIDVQMVVNGLWEAGASAIAINDIRLTSGTAIRTAGEAILVDYRPLVPPYQIVALGPPDLADRFDSTGAAGQLQQLRKDYGIESQVAATDEASVPASTANLPDTAEVVKGDTG